MRFAYLCDPAKRPVGRLVSWGYQIYDGRIYYSFTVPSESHPKGAYEILVDGVTLETGCACEWHKGKRGTVAGREKYGPVDLLHPQGFCWHLNAVSRWVRRHKKILRGNRPHCLEVNRILAEQAKENAA